MFTTQGFEGVSICALVFNVDHECRELFDVDPTTDDFIREHAVRVAEVIFSCGTDVLGEVL
jgi:hypothetical protein